MLADFGMCADVVVRTDSSIGTRTRSLPARADSPLVVQQRAQEGSSLEEGAGRHERERRADETSGREACDEPVDSDGLRVQRWANLVSAACAVTDCFQHDQIVFSGRDFHSWRGRGIFQCLSRFEFQHENCLEAGGVAQSILERDCRAVPVV